MLEAKYTSNPLGYSCDLRLKFEWKREGGSFARYSIFNTTNVYGVHKWLSYKLIRRDIKTIVEINELTRII